MRNLISKDFKKLFCRKELISDFITIVLVMTALMIVPIFYGQIATKGVRLVLTILIIGSAIVTTIYSLYGFTKRKKTSGKFNWIRLILVVLLTLLIVVAIASVTSKLSSVGAADTSGIYPTQRKDNRLAINIVNCLTFAILSQLVITSLSCGYDDWNVFFRKLVKAFVYIGIPMFFLMFLATLIISKVFILGFVFTIMLWLTSVSANENLKIDFSLLNR